MQTVALPALLAYGWTVDAGFIKICDFYTGLAVVDFAGMKKGAGGFTTPAAGTFTYIYSYHPGIPLFNQLDAVLDQSFGVGAGESLDGFDPVGIVQFVTLGHDWEYGHHTLQSPCTYEFAVGDVQTGTLHKKTVANLHGQVAVAVDSFDRNFYFRHD